MLRKINIFNILLLFTFVSACFLFAVNGLDGDIGDIIWRLRLVKTHLNTEWAFPYITPGRCGGFLLAADSHDLIFTIYAFLMLLIPNVFAVIKLTNLLLTFVLIFGVYRWLKYFGVEDRKARLAGGILAGLSGYWVIHMAHMSQVWAHGVAYLPWLMIFIEEILSREFKWDRQTFGLSILIIGTGFLMVNSGYYWLYFAPPIIFCRLFIELINPSKEKDQFKNIGWIALLGIFAIILSLPRLGAVYEYQMTRFPRYGGAAYHYQLVGDLGLIAKFIFRTFFDPTQINKPACGVLGPWFEHISYIGICSLIPLVVGCGRVFKFINKKPIQAIILAAVCHIIMVRSLKFEELVRFLMPVYKSLTWHWRGTAVLLFFFIVFISMGYEWLVKHPKKLIRRLGILLLLVHLCEIVYVHSFHFEFPTREQPFVNFWQDVNAPTVPLKEQYGVCALGCLYSLDTAGNPQGSISGSSVMDSPRDGYHNMNDVRVLLGEQAKGGYYLTHPWPLWPKDNSPDFERFINYKQILPIPIYLQVLNYFSIVAWLVYLGAIFLFFFKKFRKI